MINEEVEKKLENTVVNVKMTMDHWKNVIDACNDELALIESRKNRAASELHSDIYEEVNSETLLEHTKNLIIIREKADSMKDSIQVIKKELQLSQFNIIKVLHEEAAKNLTWSDDMEKALN